LLSGWVYPRTRGLRATERAEAQNEKANPETLGHRNLALGIRGGKGESTLEITGSGLQ
jgi:hypothetical protein